MTETLSGFAASVTRALLGSVSAAVMVVAASAAWSADLSSGPDAPRAIAAAKTATGSPTQVATDDSSKFSVETKKPVVVAPPSATLGLRAYSALMKSRSGNVVLSPISVELALALIGEAASDTWRVDIGEVIGHSYEALAAMDDNAVTEKGRLTLANALWLPESSSISPEYSTRLISEYRGEVSSIDFGTPEALKQVNDWVSDKTQGAIPAILDRLTGQTTMLLTNAFYFKGAWLRPFAKAETTEQSFTGEDGASKTVPMMRRSGRYPYAVAEHGHLARLFYEDTELSLLIYLPNEGADQDAAWAEAVSWLFTVDFEETMPSSSGTIALPRFSASGDMDLTDILAEIGLAGMLGNPDVIKEIRGPFPPAVSQIVQRSHLAVDERGTTASAATAILSLRSINTDTFEFIVDRPFHIALHHAKVPTPLLVGFISDPN